MSSYTMWSRVTNASIGSGYVKIKRCVAANDGRIFIEMWEEKTGDTGRYLSIWLTPEDHETIKNAQANPGLELATERTEFELNRLQGSAEQKSI